MAGPRMAGPLHLHLKGLEGIGGTGHHRHPEALPPEAGRHRKADARPGTQYDRERLGQGTLQGWAADIRCRQSTKPP